MNLPIRDCMYRFVMNGHASKFDDGRKLICVKKDAHDGILRYSSAPMYDGRHGNIGTRFEPLIAFDHVLSLQQTLMTEFDTGNIHIESSDYDYRSLTQFGGWCNIGDFEWTPITFGGVIDDLVLMD